MLIILTIVARSSAFECIGAILCQQNEFAIVGHLAARSVGSRPLGASSDEPEDLLLALQLAGDLGRDEGRKQSRVGKA